MTVRRRVRWRAAVAATVATAVLVAGCANTVSGSAQADPEATGLTAPSTGQTQTGGTETGGTETETGGTETGGTETGGTETETGGTETETGGTETGAPSTSTSGSGDDAALYPDKPLKYNEHPSSDASAAVVEGRRLAAYVVHPSAVIPEYTEGKLPTLPLKNGDALSLVFPDPVPTVATRAGMYAGFASTRGSKDNSGALVVTVMEFPDKAKAAKAATDLAAASKGDKDTPVTIPGFAAAKGWTSKTTDGYYSHAFLAVGSLVAYGYADGKAADKDKLPGIVAKYFTMQVPLLQRYTPTPADKLRTLQYDPNGIYSRTLPTAPGEGDVTNGSYSATAMLQYMSSYADDGKVFKTAGVDVVGRGRSTVYRAKDNAGATMIRDAYYQEIRTQNSKMQDYPVDDMPGVKCLEDSLSASYYCTGATGRYAFEYRSDSETDVKKSLASQIAMLTA